MNQKGPADARTGISDLPTDEDARKSILTHEDLLALPEEEFWKLHAEAFADLETLMKTEPCPPFKK